MSPPTGSPCRRAAAAPFDRARLDVPLRQLRGRRAHRSRRRHDHRRGRAPPRDAPLPESGACTSTRSGARRPLRPASGVRRSRAEHRPGAAVQRPRQRPAHRRDQRRHARQPGVRGRHDLCLVGGPGQGRDRRPSRSRRAASAPGRDQGPACADFLYRDARASICPPSCSTSITGASCCAEPPSVQRSDVGRPPVGFGADAAGRAGAAGAWAARS